MAPHLAFRPANESDAPTVAAIIEKAYQHYIPVLGGRKPRPMLDDHAARIARGETFLLEEDHAAVAVTSMGPEDGAMHIVNIAVHPAAQGKGHLRRILAFAEDRARTTGADRLTLYTNALMTRNRAIYLHFGFVEQRREELPGGYSVVFLERRLGPS